MATHQKILLFGGSFDPLHNGHLIIARHVAEHLGIDRVILIPSASPPHKQDHALSPSGARLQMCRLAVAGDPQFAISDWELGQPAPNYTLLTVRHFRAEYGPDTELCWLIGMDSLNELETWYEAAELVDSCTIVTAARPGSEQPTAAALARCFSRAHVEKLLAHVVDTLHIDIAATDIRARVRTGRSIRYLVPEPVRAYIEDHRLYRVP